MSGKQLTPDQERLIIGERSAVSEKPNAKGRPLNSGSPPIAHSSSLLLEIGTEEIPARFLPFALNMLKENTDLTLNEYNIAFSNINVYATPRRLSLIVHGIPHMQKDRIREVYGPPKKAAFDEHGKPTRAAIGFAKSQGLDVSGLNIKTKDKGEYLVAVIEQKGVAVKTLLPEVLRRIILSLNFPRSMRWGDGELRFVRPLHWILALLDRETIHFEIDGIKSGNTTKGHRFLSPGSFIVSEIPSYIHILEKNYVIVSQAARREKILEGIERLSSSVGGICLRDDELTDTVTYLVEYPAPVLCDFPSGYLKLPRELLITVMRDHQKYFAIEDKKGMLKNHFIAVSNTKEENSEMIKAGAEKVIKARFEDARFYYEEDIKKNLLSRVNDLKRVTFHDRLGTLYDKTERVIRLAAFMSDRIFPEKKELIVRAAELCKTDLVTGTVGEFPELQGLMGRYYALHDGEDSEVAEAVMEQYLPSHSGGCLPETGTGSVISLSDKFDNIVSFFSIGLIPTGSEDPFALRRQAAGIVAILLDKGYGITLNEVIRKAEENITEKRASLSGEALRFLQQRVESILSSQDYDNDLIQSVICLAGDVPLREIKERLNAIKKFKSEKGYNSTLLAIKRVNNIVSPMDIKDSLKTPTEELLSEIQEKNLYSEAMKIKHAIHDMHKNGKYYDSLKLLSTLTGHINNFFDGVLVMDKREEIRLNRLALLKEIWVLALSIADFSKLLEQEN